MATTTFRDELDLLRSEQTATRRHAEALGANLRDLRHAAGLSQLQLELRADVQRVCEWENGHRTPNAVSLERLARALDCHWTDFYRR
jgi:transcriptional regulator with XRE-family HTH domain